MSDTFRFCSDFQNLGTEVLFGIHPVASPYLLLIQSHLLQILKYIYIYTDILRSVVHASLENFCDAFQFEFPLVAHWFSPY